MSGVFRFRDWTTGYERSYLGADLVSGLSVWAVLVPTALAYSSLVGVSPIIGLYCIPLVLLAYALFGGSRLLVVGPDASVAVLAGATLASVGYGADDLGLVVSLTLIVGAIYVGFWLVRLGWVSDLIPDPVLKGMIEGIAWVTILKEVVVLLGIELSADHARFFPKLFELVQRVPTLHPTTAALGIAVLLALLLFHKIAPRLPAAFLVLGVSIVVVYFLNLQVSGVAVVGHAGEQLVDLIDLSFPDGRPTLDSTARLLGVGPRALQRRLSRNGTQFRSLLEAARKRRAAALLLETDNPVKVISGSLGYSESENFTRAFRAWYGISPSTFRSIKSSPA